MSTSEPYRLNLAINPGRTHLHRRAITLIALSVVSIVGLGGCSKGATTPTITVKAADRACTVDKTVLNSAKMEVQVTNAGSKVTEVYVYAPVSGRYSRIIGEAENIGPQTSQSFTVNLRAGQYEIACKPGMRGNGIRTRVSVR